LFACRVKPRGSFGSLVSSARIAWYESLSFVTSFLLNVEAGRRGRIRRQSLPHAFAAVALGGAWHWASAATGLTNALRPMKLVPIPTACRKFRRDVLFAITSFLDLLSGMIGLLKVSNAKDESAPFRADVLGRISGTTEIPTRFVGIYR